MNLIVTGADYSNTGLGKVPYVSEELNSLLSVYGSITQEDKFNAQELIDSIGGISGDIMNKAFHVILPIFSTNAVEGILDLKTGVRNFMDPYLNSGDLAGKYSISQKALQQTSAGYFDDCRINHSVLNSAISGSFAVIQNSTYVKPNYITSTGLGNALISTDNVDIQKYDGTNNQNVSLARNKSVDYNVVSFSGQSGNNSGNRNRLFVDSTSNDFAMVALSGSSQMSIGVRGDSSSFNLQGLAVGFFCDGLTVPETQILHSALTDFISKY